MRKLMLPLLALLCGFQLQAQIDPAPYDSIRRLVEGKYVIASDNMGFENYKEAIPALNWLLKHYPDLSTAVPKMAMRAFYEQSKITTDTDRKKVLLDSLLIAYDIKAEHFGLSMADKNRLAYRYYQFFRRDPEKLPKAYALYQELFTTPDKVSNGNLLPYLHFTREYHRHIQPVADQEITSHFYQVIEQVEARKEMGIDAKKLDRIVKGMDNLMLRMVKEFSEGCLLVDELAKEMDRDVRLRSAQRITGLSLEAQCGRTPGYEKALGILAELAPTPAVHKILASFAIDDQDYDKAILEYQSAIQLEGDPVKKGNNLLKLASIFSTLDRKVEARKAALDAASNNNLLEATAYSFVGNLYMSSFDDCKERVHQTTDRGVFMAAYDMFEKAKDIEGMNQAREQFPTVSQRHTEGYSEGESIEVGCWIQVKTKIRTRPSNRPD